MASCLKPKQLYPFKQSLVRKAENNVNCVQSVCVNDAELDALENNKLCLSAKGVDGEKVTILPSVTSTADPQQNNSVSGEDITVYSGDLTPDQTSYEYLTETEGRCWEVQEGVSGSQMVDAQGRLKKNLSF